MSYQVLARKWRPQRFDDVVGQQAVTRTLRNAIASEPARAGVRVRRPARRRQDDDGADPGARAELRERADRRSVRRRATPASRSPKGRDIDVLEIDAATHTGVDNVREVIIAGLGIAPVRNRYKIFIIDEVHQLSSAVVQRAAEVDRGAAAARRLHDGDDRARQDSRRRSCRARRSSSSRRSASRRSPISCARSPTRRRSRSTTTRCMLIARDAEGSMRDAQSALDQVIAFAGNTITADDVATVLGLVGRDLLLDIARRGRATRTRRPRSRSPAAPSRRATTCGWSAASCRGWCATCWCCRSIRRASPIRRSPREGERERLMALAGRFSREDLLRAFDLLTQGGVGHPRRRAAALSPRDGAAAVDSPAQAGAARPI